MYRSGGNPGDFLYVTGILGRSASGLSLLRRGVVEGDSPAEREALAWHRTPEPRCEVGSWLAAHGFARAMIDLSDGLSMDLRRLVRESGTGAEIYSSALPVFEPFAAWGCDPLELGFYGGEDYELLFSVPPARVSALERHYPRKYPQISRIGRLIRKPAVIVLMEQPGAPRASTARTLASITSGFRVPARKPLPGRNHARNTGNPAKNERAVRGPSNFLSIDASNKQLLFLDLFVERIATPSASDTFKSVTSLI